MITRLDQHQRKKEFWNRAFVFSNKDDSLNKAHVRYLEAALISRLQSAARAEVDNDTSPKQRGLGESEVADMQRFLDEILLLLPVLGVHDFDLLSVAPAVSPVQLIQPRQTLVASQTATRPPICSLASPKRKRTQRAVMERKDSSLARVLMGRPRLE